MEEDSEDTGEKDELREEGKEWPPVIVEKAELNTQGTGG